MRPGTKPTKEQLTRARQRGAHYLQRYLRGWHRAYEQWQRQTRKVT